MAEECRSIQLIDGHGVFNVTDLQKYTESVKLAECGRSYAVVSIMGAQSSGKSTLLNHLFGTNFKEMDAFQGRSKTTKGIWLAKCVDIEPCTLVMDLEGTDGKERGEDDTTFEKQSALFALAVSDIVLINMWCHDIGREQAANKPLLRTVFQVMMRLFTPRRTTLLFVLRDKTKSPLEILESNLREDLQKIWDSVPKTNIHKEISFSDFFIVDFVALPNYEETVETFKEQVACLRQRFFHSITPGGLAGDRHDVVPASGFAFSLQQIWKMIKDNKDLDLPFHKVMVATVRCEEIANEKLSYFINDKSWHQIKRVAKADMVPGFGSKLSEMLGSCLSEYDMEAIYFDDSVKAAKREQLKSKFLQLVQPAYHSILGHLRSRTLDDFKVALDKALDDGEGFSVVACDCTQKFLSLFDEGCADAAVQHSEWEPSRFRDKLKRDIDAHISSVRSTKLSEIEVRYEALLKSGLQDPVQALLDTADDNTWPEIRKLLLHETKLATSGLSSVLSAFDIDEATKDKMLLYLEHFARIIVESKAMEEAGQVLTRMKDRFSVLFGYDSDSMPRIWTGKEDIRAITRTARAASLKVLSIMAAIRLDDKPDNIEKTLFLALLSPIKPRFVGKSVSSLDLLASSSWDEVSSSKTLLTPVQCKSLWRRFREEMEYIVTQAIATQEAYKRNNGRLSPLVTAAIVILGLNALMGVLRNPFYPGVMFVLFLLAWSFWVQRDVPGDFQSGILSILISLATKFIPTVTNLYTRLIAEGQGSVPGDDIRGLAPGTPFQSFSE